MFKIFRSYVPFLGLLFTVMVIGMGGARGQNKTYLNGQKTGGYVLNGSLISLGPGTANLSAPMLTEAWGCGLLGAQTNEFRFYYGDQTILTGSTTNATTLKASRSFGLLGALGAGADVYFQVRNTLNTSIPAGTPTYFKLRERPTNTGISLNVGGLLGMTELNSITGIGYSAASNYRLNTATTNISCSNPYNGSENNGSVAGTQAGTTTKLLVDELGEWYAKVTPDAAYNSVRLNVAFPSGLSLANVTAEIKANVYNAFTQTDGSVCSARAQFTNAGEATGITLNTGVLGLNLNQLIANPEYAINGNPTQYSSFSSGVLNLGVASTISQTFYFDHSGTINDGVSFRMGLPQGLIDLALFGNGITFKVYKDETLVSTQTLATNILDLNLLNLISLGPGYKELNVTINPNAIFNKVVVELNAGLLNLGVASDELRVYNVSLTSAKPTFTSPTNSQNLTICSGSTAILSATTDSGNELIWYSSLSGTTPLLKNSDGTYTTPPLTINTTYYVASRRLGCAFESERVPVNVIITPLPLATISGTASVCQNAATPSITFTGIGGTAPYTFTYNINGAGNLTVTTISGNSVTVAVPTAVSGVFTYNLLSVHDNSVTKCSQNQSGTAIITVNTQPSLATIPTQSLCNNGQSLDLTTLNPADNNGSIGGTYIWSLLQGGPALSSTTITLSLGSTTYWVRYTRNNCLADQSVQVIVNPMPTAPIVPGTATCSGSPASLAVSIPDANLIYRWYTAASAGILVNTGPTFTTPPLISATDYYVEVKNNTTGCTSSTRTKVTVTIKSLPIVSAIIGSTNLCVGVGLTYTNSSSDPGVWSTSDPSVVTIDINGFAKGISVGTATITYTVTNASSGCSNLKSTTVTVYPLPTITLNSISPICTGTTNALLPYSAFSSGLLEYSIIWNDANFSNVHNLNLPTSPISLDIPGTTNPGNYTGTFILKNSTSGCMSSYLISIKINPKPPPPTVSIQ